MIESMENNKRYNPFFIILSLLFVIIPLSTIFEIILGDERTIIVSSKVKNNTKNILNLNFPKIR